MFVTFGFQRIWLTGWDVSIQWVSQSNQSTVLHLRQLYNIFTCNYLKENKTTLKVWSFKGRQIISYYLRDHLYLPDVLRNLFGNRLSNVPLLQKLWRLREYFSCKNTHITAGFQSLKYPEHIHTKAVLPLFKFSYLKLKSSAFHPPKSFPLWMGFLMQPKAQLWFEANAAQTVHYGCSYCAEPTICSCSRGRKGFPKLCCSPHLPPSSILWHTTGGFYSDCLFLLLLFLSLFSTELSLMLLVWG